MARVQVKQIMVMGDTTGNLCGILSSKVAYLDYSLDLRVLEDLFAITKPSRFVLFVVITSDFKTLK